MGNVILGKEYFPKKERYSIDNINYKINVSRINKLQPGDLLIVKTPGIFYRIGRKLTKNSYDHIAVVLYNNETLNIVLPKAVIRPTIIFTKPNRIPLIMRPKWKNSIQRRIFIEEMEKFKSISYNIRKTIIGVMFSALYSQLGIRLKMKKLDKSSRKWICTEAILICLLKAYSEFKFIERMRLDYNAIGFATTNDFFRISEHFSGLLEVVN